MIALLAAAVMFCFVGLSMTAAKYTGNLLWVLVAGAQFTVGIWFGVR